MTQNQPTAPGLNAGRENFLRDQEMTHETKHHESTTKDKITVDHAEDVKPTDGNAHKKHSPFLHDNDPTTTADNDLPPKGFYNDATRTSQKPDTLYNFDDPTARRLGPVPSEDPTNTGA
ncbi:hypothetical protein BDF20DRAFT_1000027 [Mycotypha africana]|uniref:uncharacterized protein n=1 Tax=Mycotypha africana TaxID=64632 RepID=UPI0023015A18|nr:uncharacterized protein BDF20DRAFT_1000027 [Mycotypha africana]KAI8981979.1 hypothetical protein BDF20DRAFT_1000027 [Mycotypha africana]